MNPVIPPILLVASTTMTGWAALWPIRKELGVAFYHASAFPTGLLAWTFVTAISTAFGSYNPLTMIAGLLTFVLCLRAIAVLRRVPQGRDGPDTDRTVRGFAIAAVCLTTATLALTYAGVTVTTADSWKGYWPLGMLIESHASYTAYLPSARGFVLPSLSAASVFFGSEWEYVAYPILAGSLLVGIATTLLRSDLCRLPKRVAIAITAAAILFLLADPSFLYHSLYVHSHLVTAAYLFFALAGARLAFDPEHGELVREASAWLIVAGMSTAGIALTRPDGLAYAFIPIAIVIAILASRENSAGETRAFYAPLLVVLGVSLGASYLEVGVWQAAKLDGTVTAVIYGLVAASALSPRLIRSVRQQLPVLRSPEHMLHIVIAVAAVLVVAATFARWQVMSMAILNARANLFTISGGYGMLWQSLSIALAASMMTGDAFRMRRWSSYLFTAIALFFLTAALVHGTSHPGRVGSGDSFNRVAFHIVPVIVWYCAIVAGRLLGDLSAWRSAGAPRRSPRARIVKARQNSRN